MTSNFLSTFRKATAHGINSQAYVRPFLSPELDGVGLEEGSGYA